jgi:hypothetical protein
MYKEEMDAINKINSEAQRKESALSEQIVEKIKPIYGKYKVNAFPPIIYSSKSAIIINVIHKTNDPISNGLITELSEAMNAKDSYNKDIGDKIEFTFKY